MRQTGMTLVELFIGIAIASLCLALLVPIIFGTPNSNAGASLTFGVNGLVEERCVSGYKFVIGGKGYAQQVLDKDGKGIPCK
jgi:competence protein ComGC